MCVVQVHTSITPEIDTETRWASQLKMLKLFSNPHNADLRKAHLIEIILNKEKAERAVVTPSTASSEKRMMTMEKVNKVTMIKLSTNKNK